MKSQKASVRETAWSVTDIEVTARDLVDVGVWETAEEEEEAERARTDTTPEAVLSAGLPEPAATTPAPTGGETRS